MEEASVCAATSSVSPTLADNADTAREVSGTAGEVTAVPAVARFSGTGRVSSGALNAIRAVAGVAATSRAASESLNTNTASVRTV